MIMSKTMVLRTESGKWQREALLHEDPVLSPLVPDLPEGVIEDELVLSGTVAEILEEEWSYYEQLLDYIAAVGSDVLDRERQRANMFGGEARVPSEAELSQSENMNNGIHATTSVFYRLPVRLVYLHQVARIAQLINMPHNWIFFVGVSYTSPQIERIRHIRTMGRIADELGLGPKMELRASDWGAYSVVLLLRRMNNWIQDKIAEVDRTSFLHYLWGLVRNATLRSVDENKPVGNSRYAISWDTIIWSDIEQASSDIKSSPNNIGMSKIIINSANLLSGKGDIEDNNGMASECRIQDSTITISEKNLPLLYKTLLLNYPQDVDPTVLGLDPIILTKTSGTSKFKTAKTTRGDNVMLISNMIPWIHFNTLLLIPLHKKRPENNYQPGQSIAGTMMLTPDLFPSAVELIGRSLGLEALTRILLSLLHYIQKLEEDGKKANERANSFANLIEAYLEEHQGEDRELAMLPSRDLVKELILRIN